MLDDDPTWSDMLLRVKRGAAFLDEEHPDWEQMINLDTLHLNDECQCVLGQIGMAIWPHGAMTFSEMRSSMTDHADFLAQREWSDDHGFTAPPIAEYDKWALLTKAWRAEIKQRLEAAK